jgi:NPCBM/NEW2 domain-containing protein
VSWSYNSLRSLCPRGLVYASLWWAMAVALAPSSFARPADSTAQDGPVFSAVMLDGRTQSGRLVSLGPGAMTLASAEGAKHELPLSQVFKLTRDVPGSVAAIDRSMIVLPEGDCLMRVTLGTASETALDVQSDTLGKLAVPLDCLLGWIMAVPAESEALDAIWDRVRLEPRKEEVVWLLNGDRLSGGFLGWDERKIKIQVNGKPLEVERTGIIGVGFDPALVNYARPKSGFLEVKLKDGTRLGVTSARVDESNVLATARFGQKARFFLSELVSVHVRSPSFDYLTERKPVQVAYFPYVGPTREFRVDRTVDGHLFELSGQIFDRGIGAQSRTLLAYRIEPGDRRFQALVGVDGRAGPLGSVVFRVLVDQKERFKSEPVSNRDAPQSIDVDVSGGKFLILDTSFGDRGNVRDLADWVEARMVR